MPIYRQSKVPFSLGTQTDHLIILKKFMWILLSWHGETPWHNIYPTEGLFLCSFTDTRFVFTFIARTVPSVLARTQTSVSNIMVTVQHRHNDNEVIAWNTSLSRCIRSWSFKDGLRWVSVGPWNPAARSSPSRISACSPRPRNNHRRCTVSAASSGNCRSSRGSSSLAVRLGRSVFARAPTKLSYFRAAIDSNRSDCCFAEQSPPFPAEKRTFF